MALRNNRTIVILTDWYLPGYKAGGPIKSISSLVYHLNNEFDFKIITTDRDFGDLNPYSNILTHSWLKKEYGEQVLYLTPEQLSKKNIKKIISEANPDLVYCNSLFSYFFSIIPVFLLKTGVLKTPLLLAPRGMLGDGALKIKSFKKKIFISIFKIINAHKSVYWHSTSNQETAEIIKVFGNGVKIFEAGNLQISQKDNTEFVIKKNENELKLLFLSRISQKKNLLYALEILDEIRITNQSIIFDIVGPIEDLNYWKKCEILIEKLSKKNIQVNYIGAVESNFVKATIEKYHFLFLPTLNENFGHVIVEALFSSRPVIISDNTPWRELKKHNAGWDIDLRDKESFKLVIENGVKMEDVAYQNMCKSAFNYAKDKCNFDLEKQKTIEMFYSAMKK